MTDPTLPTLISVVRAKPTQHDLCCPVCGRDIVLRAGFYICIGATCRFEPATTLLGLAARA